MSQQQLYASFLLDKNEGLEIALRAEWVAEATPLIGPIQRLPSGLPFVEGLMHLRSEVIPLINLKKRLSLGDGGYGGDAKVAVVQHQHRRFGLLFDDIMDVFAAAPAEIVKIDGALISEDRVISSLINRDHGRRTVEVLDLGHLFPLKAGEAELAEHALAQAAKDHKPRRLSRYVVFTFAEQLYGVPVHYAQEITFFDAVEQMYRGGVEEKDPPFSNSLKDLFKHSNIDGALTLRGRRLPVLNARRLLAGPGVPGDEYLGENTRILVVSDGTYAVGVIVEEVKTIEAIPDDEIMAVGVGHPSVSGIYQRRDGANILLLDIDTLIEGYSKELKALARLTKDAEDGRSKGREVIGSSHHLITENCYLIFRAGKNLAVRLKDVQEIIDKAGVLGLPGESGYRNGVINLRGTIVPVVDLRAFYGFSEEGESRAGKKLILCRSDATVVALEVDAIVTIHKQEQYQTTTSVKKELAKRKDTLDRLIVYQDETGASEHVFVVNVHNLMRNHLAGENP